MNRSTLSKLTAVLLSLMLCAAPMFGQSEKLKTDGKADVQTGRNAGSTENLGGKVHLVHVVAQHADGTIYYNMWTHNLRTTAGADAQSSQMANTAAQAASCNYIALAADSSNSNAGTVNASDTTLASSGTGSTEIAANGLSRAQGTYAHTGGTAQFTVQKTFTETTTTTSNVNKTGLLNASSAGTLCFEALFTPVSLNVNDTLQVTWTVNY